MNLTRKRWLILLACCILNLFAGSLYSWSVFSAPMAVRLQSISGGELVNLAIVFTVANGISPVTMISGGFINDKLGPKWALLVGGVLFGGGMIGASFTSSVLGLICTYGLGVGLGAGMIYGTTISTSVKFFPDRRGLAGGLTTAAYGGSSIIVPIVANAIIQRFQVTAAFQIIGLSVLLVACASSFVIKQCPKDFVPEGWTPMVKAASLSGQDRNFKEMVKTPQFYMMMVILICGAFSGLMIISQTSPIAQKMLEFTPAQAATAVATLALFNTCGRVISGIVSDRIGVLNTLTITLSGSIVASLLLRSCHKGSAPLFYVGLAITGLCFGGVMAIFPSFTASQFGSTNNSVNYGIMFIGFAFAGIAGPMIMSRIFALSSQYEPAFLVSAAFALLGLLMVQLFIRVSKRNVAVEVAV